MNVDNLEWRNINDDTVYPFEPGAALRTRENVRIDNPFVDAQIRVETGPVYLSRIDRRGDEIDFYFGDGSRRDAYSGSAVIDRDIVVSLYDAADESYAGFVCCNDEVGAALRGLLDGSHRFAVGQANLCVRTYDPSPTDVLTGANAGDGREDGDIWLVGESGVNLRTLRSDSTRMEIAVDIVGDPLFLRARCTGDSPETTFVVPRFVKKLIVSDDADRVVEVTPDETGRVRMLLQSHPSSAGALRLDRTQTGLRLALAGSTKAGGKGE